MNSRAELLEWKRQRLLAECAAQRHDLAVQLRPMAYTLESVSTGWRILNRIRRHPGWIAVIAAGLLLVSPRRLSAAFRFGTACLRTWRSVAPMLGYGPSDAH
jgi:hypothetical protein